MSDTRAGADGAWADFWGGNHSIYVNRRHVEVHYARLAEDLTHLLSRRQKPKVLDWGCGDALGAERVAKACGLLMLYDAVPAVQKRLLQRFAGNKQVKVLDNADWETLPPATFDVIIIVSVAQYLSREELGRRLDELRRLLRADGEIILADIIPPDVGMATDIMALLGPAWQHGYFVAACLGLVKTFFSEYRKIRATAGFSCYREPEFLALLAEHGFKGERLPHNVGFNQQRMTFRAKPV
jgi:SAM-dependent methyltransferase